jgi:tellurite resistance protein
VDFLEDIELLKAALAVAVADGELRRSELGVVKGLAARLGVGKVSFDAMCEAAERDDSIADNILIRSKEAARQALELLVGQARIDGEISQEECSVLVRIAASLGISGDDFQTVYQAGIRRADKIRKSHDGAP